jgi:cysteine desulfurase family protein
MIYLDNAATSFPKPASVIEAMVRFQEASAGNPGRSGHALATAAQRTVDGCRLALARLFGAEEPSRIAFTLNATDAINIALKGTLSPGDHVVTTSMEHNAVARPLRGLRDRGVEVTYVQAGSDGVVDPVEVRSALRPNTKVVGILHASNVTGAIQPIAEVGRLAREHEALFLADAAQSAGCVEIDVQESCIDLLACSGHKGLLGPTGTGLLYVGPRADVAPFREGGTGSQSELDEHPMHLPDRLEAGTLNVTGIAGLSAGLAYIAKETIARIRAHEAEMSTRLRGGLEHIPGLTLYGPADAAQRTSVVSFTMAGLDPADIAAILDTSFGIAVRPGLHCAPLAHRTIGTFPRGTVRMSPGHFTTIQDIDAAVEAVASVQEQLGG